MPRNQGKKIKGNKLGSSLIKSRNRKKVRRREYIAENKAEQIEVGAKQALESKLEIDSVSDFLYKATLAQKQFEASKERTLLIYQEDHFSNHQVIVDLHKDTVQQKNTESIEDAREMIKRLKVPRRPRWDGVKTPKQQILAENINFNNWRKALAMVEDKFRFAKLTPYEKNIEMWKQLWRVAEKSDILVQIVDGRDPMFYRCEDFNAYVKEIDPTKMNFLLVNKSDLLSEEVRIKWCKYFNDNGIDHVFFSALQQQGEIDSDVVEREVVEDPLQFKNTPSIVKREELKALMKSLVKSYRQIKKAQVNEIIKEATIAQENELEITQGGTQPEPEVELGPETEGQSNQKGKKRFEALKKRKLKENPNLVCLGMVGFPNVGKSSVINVLCGQKLVGVAARPGKTRNFQTIFLEKDLLLCDCPGLVFPSIVSSKAQMVCNGVYPIDNLKHYMPPIKYLAKKIPRKVFEYVLKFSAATEKTYIEAGRLIHCFANSRGYVKPASGLPDYHKSARIILKKLVTGELIYAQIPETEEEVGLPCQFNVVPEDYERPVPLVNIKDNKGRRYISEVEQNEDMNEHFFDKPDASDYVDVTEFGQEEIIKLVSGQQVLGCKLHKAERRQLKFAIKGDAGTEAIFKMLDGMLNTQRTRIIHTKKREAEVGRTEV